jgi:hypothetical protein
MLRRRTFEPELEPDPLFRRHPVEFGCVLGGV